MEVGFKYAFTLKMSVYFTLCVFSVILTPIVSTITYDDVEFCVESDDDGETLDNCCTCPMGYFATNFTVGNATLDCSYNDTWSENTTLSCTACAEQCANCTGPNPEDCSLCKNVRHDDVCLDKCPEGFVSGAEKICEKPSTEFPVALVAGATAGGVVVLIIIIVILVVTCKRRKTKSDNKNPIIESCTREEQGLSGPGAIELASKDEEMTLNMEITRGHDRVLRYTQDPTENIPARPVPDVDDRKSDLYENFHHAKLHQQISKESQGQPISVGRPPNNGQESPEVIYENTVVGKDNSLIEAREIQDLPVAPNAPPVNDTDKSGSTTSFMGKLKKKTSKAKSKPDAPLMKGPNFKTSSSDVSDIPENHKSKPLMKGPNFKTSSSDVSDIPENHKSKPLMKGPNFKSSLSDVSDNSKDTKSKPSIMKGPKFKSSSSDVSDVPNDPKTKPSFMKGPNFKSSSSDISGNRHEKAGKSVLMMGPNFQSSSNDVSDTKCNSEDRSTLMKGPSYGKGDGIGDSSGSSDDWHKHGPGLVYRPSVDTYPGRTAAVTSPDDVEDYLAMTIDGPQNEHDHDAEDYMNIPETVHSPASEQPGDHIYGNL